MSMKPQAWYWRRAVNGAQSLAEVQAYALTLVSELEAHKAALRAVGVIPPKMSWAPGEREDKGGHEKAAPVEGGEQRGRAMGDQPA